MLNKFKARLAVMALLTCAMGSAVAINTASADIIKFNKDRTVWFKYAHIGNGVLELTIHDRTKKTMCIMRCTPEKPYWHVVHVGPNKEPDAGTLPAK
jgi:hypothetical protein